MARVRDIVTHPSDILLKPSVEWNGTPEELTKLVDDLTATLAMAGGVGLAAVQIGIPTRVAIVRVQQIPSTIVLVNPIIIPRPNTLYTTSEGCLSVPTDTVTLDRHREIDVIGARFRSDPEDTGYQKSFSNLAAQAIQHEVDHMDGKLIINYTTEQDAKRITRRMKKWQTVGMTYPQGAGKDIWIME
jgi:peptide deformylase